jgi:hypothetical protein
MTVNNFKIIQNTNNEYKIVFPVETDNTYLGLDMGVEVIQNEVVNEIIGTPKNYEITRFEPKPISPFGVYSGSSLNFKFNFYSGPLNGWVLSYSPIFEYQQIYYNTNSFSNSFYKLDFYDSREKKNQKIVFTVIIPTQQGEIVSEQIFPSWYANDGFVNLKTPYLKLDYLKDKEGYFIYFLSDPTLLNINEFYASFKFFDGTKGNFKSFLTINPSTFTNNNFNPDEYSFLKVVLNYSDYTYQYIDNNNNPIGSNTAPINLYEYVNP